MFLGLLAAAAYLDAGVPLDASAPSDAADAGAPSDAADASTPSDVAAAPSNAADAAAPPDAGAAYRAAAATRPAGPPPDRPRSPPAGTGFAIPRPLEGNYPASLIAAIVALSPFIVVTTAYAMFTRQIGHDIGASRTALSIIAGLSTAGYAWGALLGGDLVQRVRQRHVFFLAEAAFAIGCLLAAIAGGTALYAAGRVLSGFATGLLLVAALPPVIQRFPAGKLPITVVAVNIGFFGAVCIGPLLGGWVAAGHHWRWFYGALGVIGAANLVLAAVTLPDQPPFNPGLRLDVWALLLGFGAVVLPFWASGELIGHGFADARFTAPMFAGLACFVTLLVVEYRQQDPLSPVKAMWNTPSITGTLVAMIGGGVFVAFLELAEQWHMEVLHHSPLQTGLLFWPPAVGALAAAALFGAILRTRLIPLLILGGMACLIGGGAMLLSLSPHSGGGLTLGAAGLLGLGAGATVSPGLYLAGFPLPSQIIGRVFALVELVRSLADYIIAPVMAQLAVEASAGPLSTHGVHLAVRVALWLAVAFVVLATGLYGLGGGGLPRPDLEGWLANRNPAIPSVPLLARLRRSG